ncbi:MAG: biotin/lipoyl-containing protein [Rhodospirillales bacterium]|jgi:acetyl-CoA carboxylase biotin carboxyl carrier protein|nr:acetyl-CoA carboxylase biotin carboxyl carrier protein subunit [Rhodospirillaceae bacterium]MDP6427047.1 biotin/lipoyl-containing protein [Rhodospirillales bacterium]MDP6645072.1 biotin/lipoyl-containing protein [Rhodospirillales bacterium]MDP6843217.1 biotin/lipoyl-containing protein [Rhodospirillales bacterium]|tara:strand:- start:1534 stop:2019 length:486 start_codon:yes stop_codon:yes gene_type:complete
MKLSDAEIKKILELIDDSGFDYMDLDMGDLRLTVSRGSLSSPDHPHAYPPAPDIEPEPSDAAPEAAPAPAAGARAQRPGLVAVKAPMVGVFYAAANPEAPPFVEKGAPVDADTTLGLIEVMKVYNAIRAGTRGVIAEILVANAEPVSLGQDIFLIEPDAGQ